MTTFLAIYHGKSVGDAQLIAVSADVLTVAAAAKGILGEAATSDDPILAALQQKRLAALRLVAQIGSDPTPNRNTSSRDDE